jgi:4'-phosphopantetheinyl transferase
MPSTPSAEQLAAPVTAPDGVELWLGRAAGSRILLAELLGARLGCRAGEVVYTREPCPVCGGPDGRPAVAWPALPAGAEPLHFSLSRRSDAVLIALAGSPVGVDLEVVPDATASLEAIALLHADEQAELARAAPARRAELFTRIWVRKEAYLKGIGSGIAHGLDGVYLGEMAGHPDAPRGWAVCEVPVAPGYAAALATLN